MQLKSGATFFCSGCGEELRLSQAYYSIVFVVSLLFSALIVYLLGARGVLFLIATLVSFYLLAGYGSFLWGVILLPPKLHVVGPTSILDRRENHHSLP